MNHTKKHAKKQGRKGLTGKLLNLALAPFTEYGHGNPGKLNMCIRCHKRITGGTWRKDYSAATKVNGTYQRIATIAHGACIPGFD